MSGSYDRSMTSADRRIFGDTRQWVCGQATGDVLEVAIGTGLNLPHYPADVRLTGVEFSPGMLALARDRAGGGAVHDPPTQPPPPALRPTLTRVPLLR